MSGARAALAQIVGVAASTWLLACSVSGPGPAHPDAEHPLLGAPAPPIELPTPDRKGTVRLEDQRGKVVVVDFWATWCEPCRQSFPAYQSLTEASGGQLVVIGVSVDEDPSGIAAFVERTGARFPVAWDDAQAAAGAYDPPTMPTSYVIDRNGIVRFVHVGFRAGDEVRLREQIESLY